MIVNQLVRNNFNYIREDPLNSRIKRGKTTIFTEKLLSLGLLFAFFKAHHSSGRSEEYSREIALIFSVHSVISGRSSLSFRPPFYDLFGFYT